MNQLQSITGKLQELLKKFECLQKENERLRSEIIPAQQREAGLLKQIEKLELTILALKSGAGKLDEADKKELDKKLHGYLREIDRCITMLSE